MGNLAEIFRTSLREEGLHAEVMHWTDADRMAECFKITKRINGESKSAVCSITEADLATDTPDEIYQRIACEAADAAQVFDGCLTERIEWGESSVHFDMKDGYKIECCSCGASSNLDDLPRRTPAMAETAVPNPTFDTVRALSEVKIKMTLQAMLKDECDETCANSPTKSS